MGPLTVCVLLGCGTTFVYNYIFIEPTPDCIYKGLKPEGSPGCWDPCSGTYGLVLGSLAPRLGPQLIGSFGSPYACGYAGMRGPRHQCTPNRDELDHVDCWSKALRWRESCQMDTKKKVTDSGRPRGFSCSGDVTRLANGRVGRGPYRVRIARSRFTVIVSLECIVVHRLSHPNRSRPKGESPSRD